MVHPGVRKAEVLCFGFVFSLDGHFLLQPLSPAGWLPVAVTVAVMASTGN